jgi:hypothetical protein
MPSNSAKETCKVWGIESTVWVVKGFRDKKMGLPEGFGNVQCKKSSTDRNWPDFSQRNVCSVDISSHRIKVERNGCAALNVANGATRSVQANVESGFGSPAMTVSTTRVIYMTFLSNVSFQFGPTYYYFDMFPIQSILFFLHYEVPLIFTFYAFSPLYVTFPHYYNATCLKILENVVL